MKTYVKPELFYESFELSQSIASCAWDMSNSKNADECSALGDTEWGVEPLVIFNNTSVCEVDGSVFEDICYTNGSTNNNVFNS